MSTRSLFSPHQPEPTFYAWRMRAFLNVTRARSSHRIAASTRLTGKDEDRPLKVSPRRSAIRPTTSGYMSPKRCIMKIECAMALDGTLTGTI